MSNRYFTAEEAGQFTFFWIPKALMTQPEYRSVSVEAKFLYGLLLDRMSLSEKNGWCDVMPDGGSRVYIYFTVQSAMVTLSCGGTVRINGADLPKTRVEERFRQMTFEHIEYVFDRMDDTPSAIRNIRAYLLTALYNAPVTMDSYYTAMVNRDMPWLAKA